MSTTINVIRGNTTIYEVYYGASRLLGTSTIDLSELNYNNIEISGAGILGDFNMVSPGMMDNLELTLHWRTIHRDLTLLGAPKAHTLTLRSAQNNYEAASGLLKVQPVKIVARGLPQKTTLGKLEKAAETESESTLNLDYIKVEVSGKVILEYDKFNYVFKVNGTDYMKATATAVGR